MAVLIPPTILAALLGASVGNAIKQLGSKRKGDNRITLEPFPGSPSTPATMTGSKRKANNNENKLPKRRKTATTGFATQVIRVPIAGGAIISRPRVPRITSTAGSTIVTNSETIVNMTIPALGAFGQFSLPILPGLPTWLAGIGDLYSKFRWRSMEVIYMPSCPTTTQGKVCMALTYDRLDGAPVSFASLTQTYRAITFPVYAGYDGASGLAGTDSSSTIAVRVDPSRFDKPWYPTISQTAFNALAANIQNQYCPVTVFVATEGGPTAATVIGDLYFKYTVEFIEPINPGMNA